MRKHRILKSTAAQQLLASRCFRSVKRKLLSLCLLAALCTVALACQTRGHAPQGRAEGIAAPDATSPKAQTNAEQGLAAPDATSPKAEANAHSAQAETTMDELEFVSLIRLLQAPEQYHGKRVRVIGYGAVEFEHKALYVSSEAHRHAITKNGLWLELKLDEETLKLNQNYLLVEATFDKDKLGHLRMFSGGLTEVTRVQLWSKDSTAGTAPSAADD